MSDFKADGEDVSLGTQGLYYSIRHSLGYYRSCGVAATYHVALGGQDHSETRLGQIMESCIQMTIQQHPGLCYGPADSKHSGGFSLGFAAVPVIHRECVLEYIDCNNSHTLEEDLCCHLETAHAQLWPAGQPAWRVLISRYPWNTANDLAHPGSVKVGVAFLSHHAIADGLSGVAFHKSIAANFGVASATNSYPKWPIILTETKPAPESVDNLINFPLPRLIRNSAPEMPVWGGKPITLRSLDDFRSRIRIVAIPAERVSGMLQTCKQLRLSLTSMLHGMICNSLARRIPGACAFRTVTPYSLRRFTHVSPGDIVNHVSTMTKYVSGESLDGIRATSSRSRAEYDQVVELARDFGGDMAAELERFPRDNAWATISHIPNLDTFFRSKLGKDREYTYELSNLGSHGPFANDGLIIDRLIFTQSGNVAGPALGLNCVSVGSGVLTISITWQHGIIDDLLTEQLAYDLEQQFVEGLTGQRLA